MLYGRDFTHPRNTLVSIFTAIMLCCSQFAVIVDKEGISVVVIVAFFLLAVLFGGVKHITQQTILLIGFILTVFFINLLLVSEPVVKEYFECFLCFGIPFLLLPYHKVDAKIVIRTVFCISLLALPSYLTYNYGYGDLGDGTYEAGYLMTMSYRMLILIFACFLMAIARECLLLIRLLALLTMIIYLALFFIVGSRGAIISLFAFLFILYIHSSPNSRVYKKRILLTIGLVIVFVLLFGYIIDVVFNLLGQRGINVLAIERLYSNLNEGYGSLDTGRSSLYSSSIDNFISSPLFGTGIGSSNNYKIYPHNLFLQIMEEGGLLFLILFSFLFLKGFALLLRRQTNNNFFTLLAITFCSGVIQLFFSFHYWGSFFFWSYIGLVMNSKMLNSKILQDIKNENSYSYRALRTPVAS